MPGRSLVRIGAACRTCKYFIPYEDCDEPNGECGFWNECSRNACPDCNGTGYSFEGGQCDRCNGTGEVEPPFPFDDDFLYDIEEDDDDIERNWSDIEDDDDDDDEGENTPHLSLWAFFQQFLGQ